MFKKKKNHRRRRKEHQSPALTTSLWAGESRHPHLVLELIMEISLLFLGPNHIHDLAVFREAGGAVGITF